MAGTGVFAALEAYTAAVTVAVSSAPTISALIPSSATVAATVATTAAKIGTARAAGTTFPPVSGEINAEATTVDLGVFELLLSFNGGFNIKEVGVRETARLAGGTMLR